MARYVLFDIGRKETIIRARDILPRMSEYLILDVFYNSTLPRDTENKVLDYIEMFILDSALNTQTQMGADTLKLERPHHMNCLTQPTEDMVTGPLPTYTLGILSV